MAKRDPREQETVLLSELSDAEIMRGMGWTQAQVNEFRSVMASGESPDDRVLEERDGKAQAGEA